MKKTVHKVKISQSVSQSVSQPVRPSVRPSVSQSVSQTDSQSVSHSMPINDLTIKQEVVAQSSKLGTRDENVQQE